MAALHRLNAPFGARCFLIWYGRKFCTGPNGDVLMHLLALGGCPSRRVVGKCGMQFGWEFFNIRNGNVDILRFSMVVEVCTKGIACEFLGRSVLSDFMTACADLFLQVVLMHLLALGAF